MGQNPAGIRLNTDTRVNDGMRISETPRNLFGIKSPAKDLKIAPWAIQGIHICFKAVCGEDRRGYTIMSGLADMQRLHHATEVGTDAGPHTRCNADGVP